MIVVGDFFVYCCCCSYLLIFGGKSVFETKHGTKRRVGWVIIEFGHRNVGIPERSFSVVVEIGVCPSEQF